MKILLIYPEIPETVWTYEHIMKFFRKKAGSPPLGLLTVAAMLPPEWPKRFVDMNITELEEKDLRWADYAFISAMTSQSRAVRNLIERCRKAKLKIVAGGPLFTRQYQEFEGVDHFVLNEAEITLPPFIEDIKQNAAKHVYKTSEFADLSETPVPLWKLADMKQYMRVVVETSRGCPYNCEFCDVTILFGHKHRVKSERRVIAELNSLYYDHGWRGQIEIADDNFIGDKKRLKTKLLPALIKWQKGKGIMLYALASIDLADDEELIRMMAAAGFNYVFIGIETPDQDSLEECGKKQNKNRDFISDINRIQQMGIQVDAGFIVGFDNDAPSIFQRQIDLIKRAGIAMAIVGILQAIPGTGLYKRLEAEGRLIADTKIVEGSFDTLTFIPAMGSEALLKGHKEMTQHLYSSANYYQRVKTFLLKYKTSQKAKFKAKLRLGDILPLAYSVYYLGVIDKDRVNYWKLLLWTILKRPKLLFNAMENAILGCHFRKFYNPN